MIETTNKAADRQDGSVCVVDKTVHQQLQALQAGMDDHLNDLRNSFLLAEKSVQAKKTLCATLPAHLPFAPTGVRITDSVYKADAELSFELVSREQVLHLFEVLPGVAVVKVQGGTAAFVPEERFTPNRANSDVVTPVGEMIYRVFTWLRGLKEEYYWWTRLGDKLVRISVSNEKSPQVSVRGSSRIVGHPDSRETTWNYTGLPCGELTRWYGGSASNIVPLTVHVARGRSIVEALTKTMSTVAKAISNKCDC